MATAMLTGDSAARAQACALRQAYMEALLIEPFGLGFGLLIECRIGCLSDSYASALLYRWA